MTNFRNSYPIDFDLYDKDTQNVLYIEDTSDQTLTLQLRNASTQTIQLDDLTANPVSASHYHFALRFRPGTLSQASLGNTTPSNPIQLDTATSQNWEMLLAPADPSGTDVIYLKSKSNSLSMALNALQTLVFDKVGANAGQGARGTRVELQYQSMAFSGTPPQPVSGNREIHLSVVNHRGKQNIPLHVGFVGDNAILNDGTKNTLKLRFSNTLVHDSANSDRSKLTFLHHDTDATKSSKFILSFDAGASTDEWALNTENIIKNITMAAPNGWYIHELIQGQNPEWILSPTPDPSINPPPPGTPTDQVLHGRYSGNPEHFDLDISDIESDFPTGHTQLHIRYENIPGYWDGQMKVTLEKRPLHYNGGNVGIGKTNPSEKLEVIGNIKTSGVIQADGTGDSYLMGNVGIGKTGPNSPLSFGATLAQEKMIGLYDNPNDWYGLGITNGTMRLQIGNSGAAFKFYEGDTNEIMRIEGSGRVGIGTNASIQNTQLSVVSDAYNVLNLSSTGNAGGIKLTYITFPPEGLANPVLNRTAMIGVQFSGPVGSEDPQLLFIPKTGTEMMRISQYGVSIGGALMSVHDNTQEKLSVFGSIRIEAGEGSPAGHAKLHYDNSTDVLGNGFIIDVVGSRMSVNTIFRARFDGDANWDFFSDRRLKTDIDNEKDILSRLLQLDVKNYKWKGNPDRKQKSIGFIAQDVQPLFPALVGEMKEKEGGETNLTLKYGAFGVLAVGAIKELKQETDAIITKQNKRIAKQDKLIKDLVTRLAALEETLG